MSLQLEAVNGALRRQGLTVSGAFHPQAEDGAPPDTGTLCLVGAETERMWAAFSQSPEFADGAPHPLDRWSERVISEVALGLGGTGYFPFGGPPWHPFLRWAARAESARSSPIGPSVTAARGLWASWRGAIGFRDRLDLPLAVPSDPCAGCPAPCMSACPVDAFASGSYDVPRCLSHIMTDAGRACREEGCLARQACPAGQAATPPVPQRGFHMRAFIRANAAAAKGQD